MAVYFRLVVLSDARGTEAGPPLDIQVGRFRVLPEGVDKGAPRTGTCKNIFELRRVLRNSLVGEVLTTGTTGNLE